MNTENNSTENIIKQIDEANDMIWNMRGVAIPDKNFDPVRIGTQAFEQAVAIAYQYGQARGLVNMGMGSFILFHNLDLAVKQINQGIELLTQLNNSKWVANAQLTLAIIYTSNAQSEPALYNALKGVDFYENDTQDDMDKTMAYYVTGTVFKDLKKYDEAEKYYRKGIATAHVNTTSWGGRIYTSISNIYTQLQKYQPAIAMAQKALELFKQQNNVIAQSRALTDLGVIYKKQKDYSTALNYFIEGLTIREESNLRHFIYTSLSEIALLYIETKQHNKAIDYLKRAVQMAIETNQPNKEAKMYEQIGLVYKSIEQFKEALEYTEKYLNITSQIHAKEKDIKIDNLQNELLKEKEQEIERLRNVELKNAYHLISEKNKEITDSIQYAKRIQKALLASDDLLDKNLEDYFILYKPKDIVSGDFYWATEIKNEELKINNFYLAVCDSTGHGVPGAFMSLLNITYLNEAINQKKITEPHLVFNHVRQQLIEAISQDGARDGMDGILACFNRTDNTLTYSAANNAPIINSNNKITVLQADKMPVGKDDKNVSFNLYTIKLNKGDMVYFITDGYYDQFGGSKGKKFKHKQLEELLLSLGQLPVKEQHQALEKAFENWKGSLEQIDDVLIIGLRV